MKYMNYSHLYWREKTSYLLGVLFGLASGYHFVGLFMDINDASVLRHLIYVVIDIYCVYGFLYRPGFFNAIFAALTIQQIYTHGMYLATMWSIEQRIHWISLAVVFLMPIGLAKLIIEYFID